MSKWNDKFEWAEPLPNECPPDDAITPSGEDYYRMVKSSPPTLDDFVSHRKLYPKKSFNTNECRVRSTSIFTDYDACAELKKLPLHKEKVVVRFKLDENSGVIKDTGYSPHHYSWWRDAKFNPIPYCILADS